MTAAHRLHGRVRVLEQTKRMLHETAAYIRTASVPLPRVLEMLCLRSGMPPYLEQVCSRIRDGYTPSQAFAHILTQSGWGYAAQDISLLRSCTDTLGDGMRQDQLERIRRTCTALDGQLESAKTAATGKGRVLRMLGTCGGAAVCLLLL